MVLDVVEVVRVPRVSHQRIEHVREQLVYNSILLAQNSSCMDVLMLQERVGASIPSLHDTMEDCMPPVEVVKEVDCGR